MTTLSNLKIDDNPFVHFSMGINFIKELEFFNKKLEKFSLG